MRRLLPHASLKARAECSGRDLETWHVLGVAMLDKPELKTCLTPSEAFLEPRKLTEKALVAVIQG